MPRIVEYSAPTKQVNPSDRPQAAWETAGRRIGPLYNSAAQDIRQAGAVQGQMEKDKIWPFDVYALEAANAPQVRNTTTTETTVHPAQPATTRGARGSSKATGLMIGDGTSQGWSQYASYTNGLDDHPWTYEHGEASAGAVGIAKLARAAAAAAGGGQYVDPNSNRPVNWKDLPDYNGNSVVDTPNGQFTQPQLDRMSKQYMDVWNRNMDKWNRQQDQQWNGPNGWNTRRDQWIDGKGGINDQWQQDYNRSLITQEKAVAAAKKADPSADEGTIRQNVYNKMNVTPPVQSTYGSYSDDNPDYRIRYSTPTVGDYARYAPSAVVDSVKSTFNRMFGSDEPAATADIR